VDFPKRAIAVSPWGDVIVSSSFKKEEKRTSISEYEIMKPEIIKNSHRRMSSLSGFFLVSYIKFKKWCLISSQNNWNMCLNFNLNIFKTFPNRKIIKIATVECHLYQVLFKRCGGITL
jgi:hypothetical protein